MNIRQIAGENLKVRLGENPYPGRGVVLGVDETGERLVQVYWIMGRSQNSRNRVFETDGTSVWTEAADPALVKDPRLIIYNAVRELKGVFIVSNGDQTDTVYQTLLHGGTFEQALATRAYEPDAPNYTPRITGVFDVRLGRRLAKLNVLRRSAHSDATDRLYWQYETLPAGAGYCITTYMGDGNPLPPFGGEPYAVPIVGGLGCIANTIWNALDEDNKVSLCAKWIDPLTFESELVVLNKYEKKKA